MPIKGVGQSEVSGLSPIQPRGLVEQVVDAIVEAAAKGLLLPGDRINEAELARMLDVSRNPVREALRLLESEGVVESERFRGVSLMSVDIGRIESILKVRLALEVLAGTEVMARLEQDSSLLAPLEGILARMHAAADAGDGYAVASLDTDFHRTLCELSLNKVLVRSWLSLSRQLTIIFGLSAIQKQPKGIVLEHDEVIAALKGRDGAAFEALMRTHILEYSRAMDYEKLVEQLRHLDGRRKSA